MKRIVFLSTSILFLVVGLVTSSAAEASSFEGLYYNLQVKHSGYYVDVSSRSTEPGAVLHQWTKNNYDNQLFSFEEASRGYYFIKVKHSGLYLTVENGSKANGAIFVQSNKHGGTNQQFKPISAGGGYYYIQARHSGKLLDVSGVSQKRGAWLHQWENLGADNQKFKLIPNGSTDRTPSFIVGGQAVTAPSIIDTNAPWQARLFIKSKRSTSLCGGSLIKENVVLTAAHCLKDGTTSVTIYLGDVDQRKKDSGEQIFEAVNWWIPTAYNDQTMVHDIALVQLDGKAKLTDHVKTIPIHRSSNRSALVGKSAVISGWGDTSGNGSIANILQIASVDIIEPEECDAARTELCAGQPNGGVDACQGDSGGPLAVKFGDEYKLVGITSRGIGCSGAGIYTAVSSYNWLVDNWVPQVRFTVRNDGAYIAKFKITVDHKQSGILDSGYETGELWAGQSKTYWVNQDDVIKVTAYRRGVSSWLRIKTISKIKYSSSTYHKTYQASGDLFNPKFKRK